MTTTETTPQRQFGYRNEGQAFGTLIPTQPVPKTPVVEIVDCELCGTPIPADDDHEHMYPCPIGHVWTCHTCDEDHDRTCTHSGCVND
jgi:hypothetical protein